MNRGQSSSLWGCYRDPMGSVKARTGRRHRGGSFGRVNEHTLVLSVFTESFRVPEVMASTRDAAETARTGTALLLRSSFFTLHIFSNHHGLLLLWARSCSSSIPLTVVQLGSWLTEIFQEAVLASRAPETEDSPTSQSVTFNRKIVLCLSSTLHTFTKAQ